MTLTINIHQILNLTDLKYSLRHTFLISEKLIINLALIANVISNYLVNYFSSLLILSCCLFFLFYLLHLYLFALFAVQSQNYEMTTLQCVSNGFCGYVLLSKSECVS